jgi:hypothetical protein
MLFREGGEQDYVLGRKVVEATERTTRKRVKRRKDGGCGKRREGKEMMAKEGRVKRGGRMAGVEMMGREGKDD